MAGTKIEIDSNHELVVDAIDELIRRTDDLRPVFADIGEYLLKSHDDRFDDQESPDGTPWAPLSDWYRESKKQNADKILVLDGYLRGLNRYQVDQDSLEFGTDRIYGAVHQFGASRGEFGATRYGVPIPWGDIPARPWLGFSLEDEKNILDILSDYLT
jgi:phage virion morphogenesis protein